MPTVQMLDKTMWDPQRQKDYRAKNSSRFLTIHMAIDASQNMEGSRAGRSMINFFNSVIGNIQKTDIPNILIRRVMIGSDIVTYKEVPMLESPFINEHMYMPSGDLLIYDAIEEIVSGSYLPSRHMLIFILNGKDGGSSIGEDGCSRTIQKATISNWSLIAANSSRECLDALCSMGFPNDNLLEFSGDSIQGAFTSIWIALKKYLASKSPEADYFPTTEFFL